jgi:hypothetical protein
MPRPSRSLWRRRREPRWQAIDWWTLALALGAIAALIALNGAMR